jgi:hypothetical protein
MSTNLQDYIELLTAEQHVQVDKLRESARNGVSPRVRGVSLKGEKMRRDGARSG